MNVDLPTMEQELIRDEGSVAQVYDDATGNLIKPGSTVRGNPTVGVGINLLAGLLPDEITYLLGNRIAVAAGELDEQLPWWENLDPVRQRVLINMAFNLGINGLLEFPNFLAAMQAGNWQEAAQQMQASQWWNQVGQRAVRLQYMVLNGAVQPGAI
jgi:lysozyme